LRRPRLVRRNEFLPRAFCSPSDKLSLQGSIVMDWNRVEGNWKQFTGKVKEQWGKLTDDDLTEINGRREQLEGKIQQRYGYAKDQTKKEVDDWFNRLP
jgi:uncharacterized protein YjbJ (UPF0337 family)